MGGITDIETLRSFFGENKYIKNSPITDAELHRRFSFINSSVTMLVYFDFENDLICVLKNGSAVWSVYRLKDIASAVFLAYQKPEIHLSERKRIFDEYLAQRRMMSKK